MELHDLYFPVEKILNPELAKGVELPSGLQYAVQVTKPDGTKRIVNYCSEIYHLVPNKDILPLFTDEINQFYKTEVQVKQRDWSKFFVDFIIKTKSAEIMKGDHLYAKIRCINSYDGSIKFNWSDSFWRKICKNGMMGWAPGKHKIHQMHTPAIGQEVNFSKIMEMTSEFLADMDENTEVYRELADTQIRNPLQRIQDIVENTNFPASMAEEVVNRFELERTQLGITVANDWLIYNAFNYQLNHNDDLKTKEQKRDKIDEEVLEFLLTY
jgi:hypothetical protein